MTFNEQRYQSVAAPRGGLGGNCHGRHAESFDVELPCIVAGDRDDRDTDLFDQQRPSILVGNRNHAVYQAEDNTIQAFCHKNKGRFLDTENLIEILNATHNNLEEDIPRGVKENVYFVLNNKHNAELLSRNKKCTFCDDCGVYKQGNSVKTDYYAVDSNGSIFYLEKKDKVYVRGRKRVPLNPQPLESEVIVLKRYYSQLKRAPSYKRRVSWLDKSLNGKQRNVACVEYIGTYPEDLSVHNNSKSLGSEYVRTSQKN